MKAMLQNRLIASTTRILSAIHRGSRLMLVLTVLSLSACTALLRTPAAPNNNPHQRQYYNTIDLSGRLSIRYQQDGKEQVVHGGFTWSQNGANINVTLLSPIGNTLATIDVTPTKVTLVQADQATRTATDVDTLITQTLGWPLPIAALRDWLQGFGQNTAGQHFIAIPMHDLYSVDTADNWHIRYTGWQVVDSTVDSYPKRIDLVRSTEQTDAVAIKIVIDRRQPHG